MARAETREHDYNFKEGDPIEITRRLVERSLINFGERKSERELQDKFDNSSTIPGLIMARSKLLIRRHIYEDYEMSKENTLAGFRGKLSTFPDKVDAGITSDKLTGRSKILSEELQRCLEIEDVTSKLIESEGSGRCNAYLITNRDNKNIIIDSALGQNLRGGNFLLDTFKLPAFNHIFVGTPDKLYDIIYFYSCHLGLYQPANKTNPEDRIIRPGQEFEQFFQDCWGNGLKDKQK